MSTSHKYMTPQDIQELSPPKGGFLCTIRGIQEETVDGRPQLVLYIEEDPRGIIITPTLYQDLTKHLGRNEAVEAFFQRNTLQ